VCRAPARPAAQADRRPRPARSNRAAISDSILRSDSDKAGHAFRRDVECRKKALVEPFAADHVQRLFPDAGRAHGKQAEGWAIGQLFAFQKRSRRGSGRRNRGFGIAEFRLPLRGGKNGAAIVYEFEKVELLLTGQSPRFAYVLAESVAPRLMSRAMCCTVSLVATDSTSRATSNPRRWNSD